MKKSICFGSIAVSASFLFCSCGDDPALVAKQNQQQTEITSLKGEIALLEEKLKSMPPDVRTELDEARKKSSEQTEVVENLEKELAGLEEKKRTMQAEFDKYRAKYQLK